MPEVKSNNSFLNEIPNTSIPLGDRGLAYGDGLFETMRYVDNRIPLLSFHKARLAQGLDKLNFQNSSAILEAFDSNVEAALTDRNSDALVKVVVTRGAKERGYKPANDAGFNIAVMLHDLPNFPETLYENGVEAIICNYRMPRNSRLSQIKHLNRLDQVLASQELGDADEGIVMDSHDKVIEGTKSNLIILENDHMVTPDTSLCGVEGVLLRYLKATPELFGRLDSEELSLDRLMGADGIFFVNSVFGVWPVKKIGNQYFQIHSTYAQIKEHLKREMSYF